MVSKRLSLRRDEIGELKFFYRDLQPVTAGSPTWTVSDLFAGALELFVTDHLPSSDICLRDGNLFAQNIDQHGALLKFRSGGYTEIFSNLGSLFVRCELTAGMLDRQADAFFDVPWEKGHRTVWPPRNAENERLLDLAFRIYESFTICECFLLDLAAEAFLRGIRYLLCGGLNSEVIHKIISGVPKYRLRKYAEAAPREFRPAALPAAGDIDTLAVRMDPFRMPTWASGWHSGWDEKQKDPCAALLLSERRMVFLTPCAAESTIPLTTRQDIPPFLLKSPQGRIGGLSSGAGGALVPWRGNIFKLKRCGLRNEGIVLDVIRDRNVRVERDRLIETTISAAAGLAPLGPLEREAVVARRLHEFGLEAASEPCALYVVTGGEGPSGCLVNSVKSDLRVDEVLHGLARNRQGSLSSAEIFELVSELGAAEGALYSRIHQSGMVRGISNSWFGNEALHHDGSLLLCDLETFFFPECVTPELACFYRSHEVNFFHMAVWRSLGALGPTGRNLTRKFLQAFQEIYGSRPKVRLPAPGCAEWVRAVTGEARISGDPFRNQPLVGNAEIY